MTAVLQVNCALGEVPRERSVEGIRLTFGRSGVEFSQEAGGRVMAISCAPNPARSSGRHSKNPRRALRSRRVIRDMGAYVPN
jgi:hypothetical protein